MKNPSKEEMNRHANAYRFRWHEAILKDPIVRRNPTALALAGYIMHRFKAGEDAAVFSNNSAAKFIGAPARSIARAKLLLQRRNWISRISDPSASTGSWGANSYRLSGGPEDLLLDEHKGHDADDRP
jgi:hypothetical protein